MKKYAWIETVGRLQIVKDVCIGNPYDIFPSDVAKYYSEEVPEDVINGAIFNTVTKKWENPPVVKPNILDAPFVNVKDLKEYLSKLEVEMLALPAEIQSLINNDRVVIIDNQDKFLKDILP